MVFWQAIDLGILGGRVLEGSGILAEGFWRDGAFKMGNTKQ